MHCNRHEVNVNDRQVRGNNGYREHAKDHRIKDSITAKCETQEPKTWSYADEEREMTKFRSCLYEVHYIIMIKWIGNVK